MVDQSARRQIKVTIAKPEPASEPEREYVYHWDRIIGALSALFLLIGLLGYGLYSWLRPPIAPASVEIEERQGQDEVLVGTAQQSEDAGKGPMPSPSEPAPRMVAATQQVGTDLLASKIGSAGTGSNSARSPLQSEPLSEGPPQQAAREAVEVNSHRLAEATALPAEIAELASVQTPVGEEVAGPTQMQSPIREDSAERVTAHTRVLESGDVEQRITGQEPPGEARPESSAADVPDTPVASGTETVSETESDEAVAVADTSEEEGDKGRFRFRNTSLSSPTVKRFLLAQSVLGNEPNGGLGDITVNAKGFAAVSSFSEVIGLEGKVLQYRWLHEGKEVLRLRVPVRAKRWRSHSTKRIYEGMEGAWRAELRDSAGTLLASAEFVF